MGELHHQIYGDPARPALILLHGGGAASRAWKHQFSGLADRLHMIAPDLSGFGRSPGPVSIDGSVAPINRLVRRYASVHLCGQRDTARRRDVAPISALVPNATALVVPYAGRSLPVTRAGVFNTIVSGFLGGGN